MHSKSVSLGCRGCTSSSPFQSCRFQMLRIHIFPSWVFFRCIQENANALFSSPMGVFHELVRIFIIQYFSNIFHVAISQQPLKMHYFDVWSPLEQGCHKSFAWRTTTLDEHIVFGNEVSIELQVPRKLIPQMFMRVDQSRYFMKRCCTCIAHDSSTIF